MSNKKPEKTVQLLGEIAFLMLNSPLHQNYPLGYLKHMILPPININQFRIYRKGSQPVGFVSWALFTDEIQSQVIASQVPLTLDYWRSGNNLFIIDFIVPFGHVKTIIHDLKVNIFTDYPTAKALRYDSTGKMTRVATYRNFQALSDRSGSTFFG